MATKTYILKWCDEASPRLCWFLRGIRDDGSFYGEVLSECNLPSDVDEEIIRGKGALIDGRLSTADSIRFRELAARFGRSCRLNAPSTWTGLLAEGPVNAPKVLFYCVPDDTMESEDVSRFMEIVRLFEPYIRAHYSKIT
jgi:hypothetical protein